MNYRERAEKLIERLDSRHAGAVVVAYAVLYLADQVRAAGGLQPRDKP